MLVFCYSENKVILDFVILSSSFNTDQKKLNNKNIEKNV